MSANQPNREVAVGSIEASLVSMALDHEIARRSDVRHAVNALCGRLGAYLSRWIGSDGWLALLSRALAETHPPGESAALSLGAGAELRWRDEAHLGAARDTCIQVLVSVVLMLERHIGAGLALRLVEQGFATADAVNGVSDHG